MDPTHHSHRKTQTTMCVYDPLEAVFHTIHPTQDYLIRFTLGEYRLQKPYSITDITVETEVAFMLLGTRDQISL